MEAKFGKACWEAMRPESLGSFNADDCLRVAWLLRLPIKITDKLPVPVDVTATNPLAESSFKEFRIQTVRNLLEDGEAVPFTIDDEPFDEEFEKPYFCLYGVAEDGLLEHIADRRNYSEALALARKLAPGAAFPNVPIFKRPSPPKLPN